MNINPFPNDKILTIPNSKSLQTTIFKLDENGRKLSKHVDNTARYEQFLLFPQCFQKTSTADT